MNDIFGVSELKMNSLLQLFILIISVLIRLASTVEDDSGQFYKSDFYGQPSGPSDGKNTGLAWLRGDYDYSQGGGGEALFDVGPQYAAPAPSQYQHQPQHAPAHQAYGQQQQQPAVYNHPPAPPPPYHVQQQQHPQQNFQQHGQAPQYQAQQHGQIPQAQAPQYQAQQHAQIPQAPAQAPQYQAQQNVLQHNHMPIGHGQPPGQAFPQAQAPIGQPQDVRYPIPPPNQRLPPEQEVLKEENWLLKEDKGKKKQQPNEWLFGGEPIAATFSPQVEHERQQKLSKMPTKWDIEDMDFQRQQHLKNREGEQILDQAYLTKDELIHGAGKRVPSGMAVLPGGPGGQLHVAPPSPHPPPYHHQPKPDQTFIRPKDFYKGKINPDEGTKFLTETYGIRKDNRRKPSALEGTSKGGKQKSRTHALDDPPAQIINDVRWFDDDDYNRANYLSNSVVLLMPAVLAALNRFLELIVQ